MYFTKWFCYNHSGVISNTIKSIKIPLTQMLPSLYRKTPHQEIKEWYNQDTLILPQPSRLKLKFLLSTFKDCTWPCSRAVAMEVVSYQGWCKSAFIYPSRLHKKRWCSFKYWNGDFSGRFGVLCWCSPLQLSALLAPLRAVPTGTHQPDQHHVHSLHTPEFTWTPLAFFHNYWNPPQAIHSKIRELWTEKTELAIPLIEGLSRLTTQNPALPLSAPRWL